MLSRRSFLTGTIGAGAALATHGPSKAAAQVDRRMIVDAQIHLWTCSRKWTEISGRKSAARLSGNVAYLLLTDFGDDLDFFGSLDIIPRRPIANPQLFADLTDRETLCMQHGNTRLHFLRDRRPRNPFALRLGSGHAGLDPLTDEGTLKLCQ
jgi:hypothetical protein